MTCKVPEPLCARLNDHGQERCRGWSTAVPARSHLHGIVFSPIMIPARIKGLTLLQGTFRLGIGKDFFMERVVRHWDVESWRCSGDVDVAPREVFL